MNHDDHAELEDHDRGLSLDAEADEPPGALGFLTGSVTMAALAACGSWRRVAGEARGASAAR